MFHFAHAVVTASYVHGCSVTGDRTDNHQRPLSLSVLREVSLQSGSLRCRAAGILSFAFAAERMVSLRRPTFAVYLSGFSKLRPFQVRLLAV